MPRKIYDILPPEHQAETHDKMREEHIEKHAQTPRKKGKFHVVPVLVGLVVVSLLGVFFFVQGKADVSIFPKTEDVSAEMVVNVNTSEAVIDYEKNIIPGIIFTDNRDRNQEYQSTGTDDKAKKAVGTIKVYNKIKPAKPLTLTKGTRFLSVPGELVYKADTAFTIPAAKNDVPGSIEIKVTASEAGAKYNIPSATFSVPGLNGSEYYSVIWAESSSALAGGEESQVKVVSKNDVTSAKDDFEFKYSTEARDALISTIPEGFEYFKEDIMSKVTNVATDAKEGDEKEKFSVSGNIDTKALVFKKEDAYKLAESVMKKDISELKTMVPDSITYEVKEKKTLKDGTVQLTLGFKGKIYSVPDNDFLMSALLGKDKNSSASLLQNMPEIGKIEINLSPAWKWSLPSKKEDINIKLNFDGE